MYHRAQPVSDVDQKLMRRNDELYQKFPFVEARMLTRLLRREDHEVGRQHVRTLMKRVGIKALYREPSNIWHKI